MNLESGEFIMYKNTLVAVAMVVLCSCGGGLGAEEPIDVIEETPDAAATEEFKVPGIDRDLIVESPRACKTDADCEPMKLYLTDNGMCSNITLPGNDVVKCVDHGSGIKCCSFLTNNCHDPKGGLLCEVMGGQFHPGATLTDDRCHTCGWKR